MINGIISRMWGLWMDGKKNKCQNIRAPFHLSPDPDNQQGTDRDELLVLTTYITTSKILYFIYSALFKNLLINLFFYVEGFAFGWSIAQLTENNGFSFCLLMNFLLFYARAFSVCVCIKKKKKRKIRNLLRSQNKASPRVDMPSGKERFWQSYSDN